MFLHIAVSLVINSVCRARIEAMDAESELLEVETVLLKQRLHQTKSVWLSCSFLVN